MATFTVRKGLSNSPQAAASVIQTVQWNGVGTAPPEMQDGNGILSSATACLLITVLNAEGLAIPNPEVTIIFSKAAAPLVENASSVGSGSGGYPTGYGSAEGAITAGYFGGLAAISKNGDITTQAVITHIVTGNAFGQVALKFLAAPSVIDATAIHVRCGSAGIKITDLTGLTTNP